MGGYGGGRAPQKIDFFYFRNSITFIMTDLKSLRRSGENWLPVFSKINSVYITDDFADLLQVRRGKRMYRTNILRKTIAYIKEHQLEHEIDDQVVILPDPPLLEILGSGEHRITYFNLQNFLKNSCFSECQVTSDYVLK
jgi:hypothetical protein